MTEQQMEKEPKANKDRVVRYRCDRPLIAVFDAHADKEGKNRSQVLRELMLGWVQERKNA